MRYYNNKNYVVVTIFLRCISGLWFMNFTAKNVIYFTIVVVV